MEFDWSCQGAALPFRTSSLIFRRVILRLIRFDHLCGLNASGDSGRTFDGVCLSGRECAEKEHNAHEYQNILRFDIYFNCFEFDNIGTFKRGITLFFVFIIILLTNYHSCNGTVVWDPALQAGRSRVRFPMSLEFFIYFIFPAALWPWFISASNRNECQGYFLGGKAARA
jgi:hypothetical protein